MIDITGLSKAVVIKALYDGAQVQGLGFFKATATPITVADCQELVDSGDLDFDYLQGRVMKIDLSGDQIDPRLYDRDNGSGAAARAIDRIR